MVQFNLPDNSKLTDGDYYKSEKDNKNIKKFNTNFNCSLLTIF